MSKRVSVEVKSGSAKTGCHVKLPRDHDSAPNDTSARSCFGVVFVVSEALISALALMILPWTHLRLYYNAKNYQQSLCY